MHMNTKGILNDGTIQLYQLIVEINFKLVTRLIRKKTVHVSTKHSKLNNQK